VLSIHCRLIIILSIYVWLTLTLAKVCPYSRLITLPNWLGWMKLFEINWNWRCSPITFSINFSRVLRRTIGLNDLGKSYDFLLGFRMTIVIDVLKWEDHWSSSKHVLVMSIVLFRHLLFLTIHFRYLHDSLSSLGVDELLHLAIEVMNSFSENVTHVDDHIFGISSKTSMSIWQFWTVLNDKWSTCHKSSILRQGWLLYLTASTAGSLCLLT